MLEILKTMPRQPNVLLSPKYLHTVNKTSVGANGMTAGKQSFGCGTHLRGTLEMGLVRQHRASFKLSRESLRLVVSSYRRGDVNLFRAAAWSSTVCGDQHSTEQRVVGIILLNGRAFGVCWSSSLDCSIWVLHARF